MFWRLHNTIFGDRIHEAINIISSLGDQYQIVDGSPSKLLPLPFEKISEPSLSITTLQDAQRLIRKDYPSTPWLFFNNSHYQSSYYLPRLDIPTLNKDCFFIPIGMLKTLDVDMLKNYFSSEYIFIKPDKGNKIFTGFSIKLDENFPVELKNYLLFTSAEPEELCLISSYKKLQSIEWRFWICERKIVAYSPYSWDKEVSLFEPPLQITEAAKAMCDNEWQPDYAYVADFCITQDNQTSLIEINAASTSGVYQADLTQLIKALRNTAYREYNLEN